MKAFQLILPMVIVGLAISPAWAADQEAIQGLQSDVSEMKGKADKNFEEINSLKGGLPALEARVDGLDAALSAAVGTISQLQAELAAASSRIGQLQADLTAEVAARQAAEAANMSADDNLQVQIDALGTIDVTGLAGRVSSIEETLTCVSFDPVNFDLIFVGCNVHVRDGTGYTDSPSGLGNLVVGYNVDGVQALNRFGSHNIVLGDEQAYPSSGELRTQVVASDLNLRFQADKNMQISAGNDLVESISNDRITAIGSDLSTLVSGDATVSTGRDFFESVGRNLLVQANTMNVQAVDQVALANGITSTIWRNDGDVLIVGKDISVTGSGRIEIKAAGPLILKGSSIQQN